MKKQKFKKFMLMTACESVDQAIESLVDASTSLHDAREDEVGELLHKITTRVESEVFVPLWDKARNQE